MRRRPRENAGDPNRRPSHLRHYRADDWIGAEIPPNDQGYFPGCPVCAYWYAQSQWRAAHPDAQLDLDFDAPDDPWHAELV